jgi:predicted DNA-binding protein
MKNSESKITVRLSEEMSNRLKFFARKSGRSPNIEARILLEEALLEMERNEIISSVLTSKEKRPTVSVLDFPLR